MSEDEKLRKEFEDFKSEILTILADLSYLVLKIQRELAEPSESRFEVLHNEAKIIAKYADELKKKK